MLDKIKTIDKLYLELKKLKLECFTGTKTITVNFNQGGIRTFKIDDKPDT